MAENWKEDLESIIKKKCPEKKFDEKELGWLDASADYGIILSVPEPYLDKAYYQLGGDVYLEWASFISDTSFEFDVYEVNPLFDTISTSGRGSIRELGGVYIHAPNEEGEGYYKLFPVRGSEKRIEDIAAQIFELMGMAHVPGKMHYDEQYHESSPSYRMAK